MTLDNNKPYWVLTLYPDDWRVEGLDLRLDGDRQIFINELEMILDELKSNRY